jgi:hypothetical protein
MRNLFCAILFFAFAPLTLLAQAGDRSVHLRPDADSPVIGFLPGDSLLVPPSTPVTISEEAKSEGWAPISFVDNFRGFARRSEIRKDLTLSNGTPVYLSPEEDSSSILTLVQARDLVEVENMDGAWAEIAFRKPITGFVREGADHMGLAEVRPSASRSAREAERQPVREALVAEALPEARDPAAEGARPTRRGRIAPPPTHSPRPEVVVATSIPVLRSFEGYLSPTRPFFGRSQPFGHQVIDQSGNRVAYLDLSKLLITTPLDEFYGRQFEFYGRAEALPERRDFVIRVERILQK